MSAGDVSPADSGPSATRCMAVGAAVGLAGIAITAAVGPWWLIPLAGWMPAAAIFVVWMWASIWWLGPEDTARHARREDPRRDPGRVVLLSASVVSLIALGLVLVRSGQAHGLAKGLLIGSCVASVVLSWAVVHTVYCLRYADLYYSGEPGGIDFNEDEPPCYSDFAYLAWTIGMTFQVSDTNLETKAIRRTALRHGLLSYMFGALIIGTTINLIAGLAK